MWLINTGIFKLEEFVNPPSTYAILSHTWEGEEVLFQDMENLKRAKGKAGWNKIQMTCDEARKAGIHYAWVDTCCIDKRSSAELSEAINSMFAWYQQASVCYVYFSDLVIPWTSADYAMPDTPEGRVWTDAALVSLERQLRLCRWFTRGWTLQEFIAPNGVVFFDQTWNCIGSRAPGSDLRFLDILARLTGIPRSVLEYKRNINTIPVAQRMSWAANRETTRVEDAAYCLLGIFNVNMPLLYGEGSKAFLRLQEEIVQDYDDLSVFAWKQDPRSYGVGILRGCFATSPAEFAHWLNAYIGVGDEEFGMQVTGKTVKMIGRVLRSKEDLSGEHGVDCILDLGVRDDEVGKTTFGILLTGSSRGLTHFRLKPHKLVKLEPFQPELDEDTYLEDLCPQDIDAYIEQERESISIRKTISVQETSAMGHHQKPSFKVHWNDEVSKILKTVNGQNPKDYVPCFENRLDSASYKDGSVTWITDFELQINSQLSIPLVLVTGLQWGSSDYRMPTCFDRAKLNSQEYWAVLFGQGQAYSMTGGLNFGDRPVELGRLHKIDGSEPVSKELLKHRNHRQDLMIKKRAALARDLLVFESEYKADGVEELELPRLLRVLSPVDQSPICDVWIERNWEDFDNCGELEVKVGPCQKSDWE
ncbi:hypothetical protein ACKLNR_015265 [Fusarium oxysporum f. sp. zingiberi]